MPLGVIFAFLAYAVFSGTDATIKGLGATLGIFEIGFFIFLFAILPALFARPEGERWRDVFVMHHPRLVNLRGFCGLGSAVLITYSLTTIPLAEVYAIVFLIPTIITVLSVLVLKETVGPLRWILMVVSFIGVMVVVRPGFRDLQLGHLTAVLCACFSAVTTTTLRVISGKEKRTSLIAIPALYAVVANGLLMLPGFEVPTLAETGLLFLAGALLGTGHLLLIAATKHAPASAVAPMQYSQIVWGIAFGAAFYQEFPDQLSFVGIAIVVGAGIVNVLADGGRARIGGRFAIWRARRTSRHTITPDEQGPGV